MIARFSRLFTHGSSATRPCTRMASLMPCAFDSRVASALMLSGASGTSRPVSSFSKKLCEAPAPMVYVFLASGQPWAALQRFLDAISGRSPADKLGRSAARGHDPGTRINVARRAIVSWRWLCMPAWERVGLPCPHSRARRATPKGESYTCREINDVNKPIHQPAAQPPTIRRLD